MHGRLIGGLFAMEAARRHQAPLTLRQPRQFMPEIEVHERRNLSAPSSGRRRIGIGAVRRQAERRAGLEQGY